MSLKYPIIDDNNYRAYISEAENTPGYGRGLIARDYDKEPFGSVGTEFPIPVMPREEIKERIAEHEAKKTSLQHLCEAKRIPVKNQGSTNYCWINAPVHALEIKRVEQGLPYESLSPASVGGPIKGYRNVGGWGTEGLKYLVNHGAAPSTVWPDNAIDRRYDTVDTRAQRDRYKVDEWWELQPRNLDQLLTCLVLNIPVAIGLNWWRHEVLAVAAMMVDGRNFGILIRNSWGTRWGENGCGVLTGTKMLPDDAVAPRVARYYGESVDPSTRNYPVSV